MIYVWQGGFFSSLLVLFLFFLFIRNDMKKAKRADENAKAQFLQTPQAKLYFKKGYELKKFQHTGDGKYDILLTLNPDLDPDNPKNRQKKVQESF
ncbi:hypothetical protein BKH46_08965 [Helicobacter sp. 12S02634-8]|uniref:hypothetical protein n=1 Tax=Helicobacter sp. 12S02634-8 TaxID=1476199 RepID=UPI000BA68A52|nr:hypothetical protein [Helicobacter sp. 12S02634-8]PAF46130.1 hypothetical protein BKH46_08965 [Helicobacter sp. 12S02634-8]